MPDGFVAEVPPGTSTFVDSLVISASEYTYMVSAAHHGFGTADSYNDGIWNDFSVPSTPTSPVDNLEEITLALDGADTVIVCPQGDHDSLRVLLTVHGSDASPTAGIPADEILFMVSRPGVGVCGDDTLAVHLCDGDTLAAGRATDAAGATELVYSAIGGCGTIAVNAEVMGLPVFDTLTVVIRSPDSDGNGEVNLGDMARFASAFPSNCGSPVYCTCVDYDLNCRINLGDLALLAVHWCPNNCPHRCGAASGAMVAQRSPLENEPSQGESASLPPTFDVRGVKDKVLEDGRLSIPIRIEDVSSLLACHVLIRYEGTIESAEFVPTDYLHDPLVIPVRVDEGKKTLMVAFSASQGVVTREAEGVLGSLVVDGTILPHSLDIVEATILDGDWREVPVVTEGLKAALPDGPAAGEGAAREVLETALYPSVPNPANPMATISFSLKERSQVTLRIYRVSGELVRTLVDETLDGKLHEVLWDGKDEGGRKVSSGVYFYRLEAGAFRDQKKLVILK